MINLFNKSHYSILSAYSLPTEIVEESAENGYTVCGITDYNSVSAAHQLCSAAKKKGLRSVIGCEIPAGENKLYAFCQNMTGWSNIIKLIYHGFSDEYTDGLVFATSDKSLLSKMDGSRVFDIRDLAYSESRYSNPEDYKYADMMYRIGKHTDSIADKHIKTKQDMLGAFTSEQIYNTEKLVGMLEDISLESKPQLPQFTWTDGMTEADYLRELCRRGWRRIIQPNLHRINQQEYVDRINMELSVIEGAGLSGYFLIVQDYVNWAKNNGILVGPGRGCFTPDSRVKLSGGLYKPISMINIGDKVIDAYNQEQEVINVLEYDIDEEILELEFENGCIIRCTKEHEFLTKNRGWVQAQFLTDDDDVVEIE